MSFLDALIYGVRDIIDSAGAAMPRRSKLKFANGGLADDAAGDQTVFTSIQPGGSDGEVQIKNGLVFSAASKVKAGTSYISIQFGAATLATLGAVRLSTGQPGIVWNNGAANIVAMDLDGTTAYVGSDKTHSTACTRLDLTAAVEVHLFVGMSGDRVVVTETLAKSAVPIVGLASPWSGMNGRVDVDMADADQTLTSAQYAMSLIETSGVPFTADRTMRIVAPLNDSQAYFKWIRNNDALFNLNVDIVGGAAPIAVLPTTSSLIAFTAGGVIRMTAGL